MSSITSPIYQTEQNFANLVRTYRKKHVGKGPEKIKVTFHSNWAIAYMSGSLSPVERFITRHKSGEDMVWQARTQMIKELYDQNPPTEMEELVGAKFEKLFTDIHMEDDEVISIFVFDRPIDQQAELHTS
ncbi:DUF2294 domain-containing protein [Tuberibacillus sp. Marseille-P3662]|uniref:DUF2294 domain-containing protein n=1 Tax=Tuberibacillus sp. Marseille-P3662 TaxID=1965358 RepID=UPI0020CB66A0|nr:DUF2294 domain-containing protein [Tuberibacillus sp. Marseille-P3662]